MLTSNGCEEGAEKYGSAASCSHAALYKNAGVDSNALHFKHRAETVELRKKKRDDGFDRARRKGVSRGESYEEDSARAVYDPDLISDLLCDDEAKTLNALKVYSRILSKGPAVEEALEMGLFNTFIDVFMKAEPDSPVERSVVGVLSEMSMDIRLVASRLNPGPIAKLINCLGSDDPGTCVNALFILEGIVSFDPFKRCTCDELMILPKALRLYFRFDQIDVKRQTVALINNYFTFMTPVEELSDEFLSLYEFILTNEFDEILLNEALDTLTGICHFGEEHIQKLIDVGFLSHCSPLLENPLILPSVLKLANVIAARPQFLNHLYDSGFFDSALRISQSNAVTPKALGQCFYLIIQFVKNGVLSHREDVAEQIIDGFLICLRDSTFELRKQAVSGLYEILNTKNGNLITMCIKKGLFKGICDLLTVMSVDVVLQVIDCLSKAMDYGVATGQEEEFLAQLEGANAPDKMDFLMNSQCYDIFKAADAFITKYFDHHNEE
ncbi:unnamed protein product [Bursaphelenchus xylophilus]|uniref:(pine wood nematode) hypothetical protein n=1 Tax=Bursaphelenchus xylophilus TaxID=6326 RepID=A0A1I7S5V1_BURXY|nr:unnamed protein product [Bursaphelenchus xylophilus]CAG9125089.1 unnamed protein product [Bursaphelenchus xylophilus]